MTAHVHAELMKQYAEDAAETDKPWERWEQSSPNPSSVWIGMPSHPRWVEDQLYRRKPSTININGHEVPEPLREAPAPGASIFLVSLTSQNRSRVSVNTWSDCAVHSTWLEDGLVHGAREAAELHAKALLSFTESK